VVEDPNMRKRSMIREAINRILWGEREPKQFSFIVRDRYSPTGIVEIPFTQVEGVDGSWVYLREGQIPLHRILRIVRSDGITVWDRYSELL
jgi:uncharacterized protein (UPF0248 family)